MIAAAFHWRKLAGAKPSEPVLEFTLSGPTVKVLDIIEPISPRAWCDIDHVVFSEIISIREARRRWPDHSYFQNVDADLVRFVKRPIIVMEPFTPPWAEASEPAEPA